MKTFTRGAILALVVAITFTAPSKSWGQGKGGGGSGGGTAQAAGALYGDLYVIERDGNGEPLLRSKPISGVTYTCQQPLAADCRFLQLNFDNETLFNPEAEDACAVRTDTNGDGEPDPVNDTVYLQAVSFGRESVSRAPATVINKSYGEALNSINLAAPSCGDSRAIKLDPAGRITLCLLSDTYAWKTIDAPLENLGLYRAAMTTGCFGPVDNEVVGEEGVRIIETTELSVAAKGYLSASGLGHLVCGAVDEPLPPGVSKKDMLSAAVFIAAGADKESPVTLDEIINLNNYVGANIWTYTTVRKVKTLSIDYFDFKVSGGPGGWFAYTKGTDACVAGPPDNTVPLLTKSAITTNNGGVLFEPQSVSVFGGLPNGVALRPPPPTNATSAAVTVCRAGSPLKVGLSSLNVVCDTPLTNPVYAPTAKPPSYGCGGANWFTQAAEDARKTIWYLHNWRLPVVAY